MSSSSSSLSYMFTIVIVMLALRPNIVIRINAFKKMVANLQLTLTNSDFASICISIFYT